MPVLQEEIELAESSTMHQIRNFFRRKPTYEPIQNEDERFHDDAEGDEESQEASSTLGEEEKPFSWIEYAVFFLLGIAMLWAWNMFLAAAPYFQDRFSSSPWIRDHFQSAQISVSTITNLGSMIILTKMQENASYPKRISVSLVLNIICFTLLAISTLFRTAAGPYFGFMLLMVFVASLATGFIQNGLFSYVSGFGRSEYTQAIMTGQAVAGVLPCIAQIATVLAAPSPKSTGKRQTSSPPPPENSPSPPAPSPDVSSTSAFSFFLTATFISILALFSFLYLLRRRSSASSALNPSSPKPPTPSSSLILPPSPPRKPVSLLHLFLKLPFLSTSVFLCFALTISTFPVFTTQILSLRPSTLPPQIFIPLAFLLWNTGDLLGRLLTLFPALSLTHYPFALFVFAMARLVFVPLYLLCNVRGEGAVVRSDVFYLVVVQGLFGLTNGYVGSECMMGAGEWVDSEEEKEAAGGFMGLALVAGLGVGSFGSFLVGGV